MTTIVFSKDRAMQLHAFLRSYENHVRYSSTVNVLCRTSNERHVAAYTEVLDSVPCVDFIDQSGPFKAHLLEMLPAVGNVVFFVDDQVFVRDWEGLDPPGVSLRLGLHLTRDYAFGDQPQRVPKVRPLGPDRVTWQWAKGELSWGYPLSLDGHVFDLREIRPLIESLYFQ
jgi:hypothetical protein